MMLPICTNKLCDVCDNIHNLPTYKLFIKSATLFVKTISGCTNNIVAVLANVHIYDKRTLVHCNCNPLEVFRIILLETSKDGEITVHYACRNFCYLLCQCLEMY